MLTGGPVQADAVVARKAGRRERRVLVCMVVVYLLILEFLLG